MKQVEKGRELVDRKKLIMRLGELAEKHAPQSQELRNAVLAELKQALAAGRKVARDRFEEGVSGPATMRALAHLVDQLIRVLYDFTTTTVYPVTSRTAAERLSLVAVGGYGRGELAPYSDIDLLFLFPYKQTAWGEQVVEYILYMLWDMGLKVGHSTRSVDDCIRLSKGDITIRTALLEARYLWGDEALAKELRQRYRDEVVAGTGPDFVEAKLKERGERHERFGNSRYLVEPNMKEGKGGLRDLHTLFWIAKYLYQTDSVAELVAKGVLTRGERRRFDKAEAFLKTVRCHLHYLTDRPEERLTFDLQPELARRLGYTDHAGTSDVERFMKHYYLVAKDVGDLTRIFCASLEANHKRRRVFRLPTLAIRGREVEGFKLDGQRLTVADEDAFEKDPVKLLRLFHLAQERDLDIHPNALRLVRRNLKLINRELRGDAEANRLFMEMLTSEKDPETTLRRLNEAGVFGRFIRDFGRVVAQMQHDMYHVYTVDEHTIRAIGILSRIERGMLEEEHPLSHEIVHKVLSRRVLYTAVLLHDIAKGRGGDHSVLGAEVANRLCPRLGLSSAETETVAWLVLHHLAFSNFAFKRDIADPKTVADFVQLVQSPERLRLLLILTVADIRAVGPNVWNGWKGQLLRDLYYAAEEALSGGLASEGREARIGHAKELLHDRLADWRDDAVRAYLARFYNSYWLAYDADTQLYHARIIRRAEKEGAPLTIEMRSDRFRAVTEVTVYTADHPGLFARLAGAISLAGANIVDAKICTTTDGMALDSFFIQDSEGEPMERHEQIVKLVSTIEETLQGTRRPRQELAKRRATALPSRTRVFTVQPVVLIDNNASNTHTVIEINGRDRPGLLAELTYALFNLSLTISSAHIATFGERAVDVFYVKDLFGLKVSHEGKLETIREELLKVLNEGAPAKAASKPSPAKPAQPAPAKPAKPAPAKPAKPKAARKAARPAKAN